ncbi:hypothetical protein [Amycolatopsis sp. NPDC003731]
MPGYRDQFTDLAARFDVVVFDPRGLDVTCPAPVPAPVPGPLTKSAYDAYAAANAQSAAGCPAARGRLGADQVARDMDAIRASRGAAFLGKDVLAGRAGSGMTLAPVVGSPWVGGPREVIPSPD